MSDDRPPQGETRAAVFAALLDGKTTVLDIGAAIGSNGRNVRYHLLYLIDTGHARQTKRGQYAAVPAMANVPTVAKARPVRLPWERADKPAAPPKPPPVNCPPTTRLPGRVDHEAMRALAAEAVH